MFSEGFGLGAVDEELLHRDEIVALTPKAFAVWACASSPEPHRETRDRVPS